MRNAPNHGSAGGTTSAIDCPLEQLKIKRNENSGEPGDGEVGHFLYSLVVSVAYGGNLV
jgi:hypothetical protein